MKTLLPQVLVGLRILTGAAALSACLGEAGVPAGPQGTANGGISGTNDPGAPGTGTGNGTGTGTGDVDDPLGGGRGVAINLAGNARHFRFVRLTNAQWGNAVQTVLKLPAPTGLEKRFQNAVTGTTDFSNNEHLLDVNQRFWEDYRDAAEELANQVTSSSAALSALYAGSDPDGFIRSVGRRAYRRPLTSEEVARYRKLFDEAATTMSGSKSAFAKGASLVVRAMLQSPYFLFRTELGPAGTPLSGYEIATRLSLWLRNTTPDDALLDIAPTLTTAEEVAKLASAMLEEPSAVAVMREFAREWLHFDRYAQISKLNVPDFTDALNAELEESSYLFFDKIFKNGLGVRDIFTSTTGFVGPRMAKFYGISSALSGYREYDLGPERTGYFSQLPYLTLHALNDVPDAIHRGVSLNLDVLCAQLGPPAPNIPPLPPLMPGQTNRQRIDTLTSGCGGACHNEMINPLGFAFEHFDGMGQYRDYENGGLPIDSSGSYAFSDGRKTFEDNADLMHLMAEERQTHLCYVKKLASFALQRDIVKSDLPWLEDLATFSFENGASVKRIIVELVKSDAFRTRGGAL
jgi:hypothetical protein